MTRRIHRCLTCQPQAPTARSPFTLRRGFTRHRRQVCAACRREGVRAGGDQVTVTLNFRIPDAMMRAEVRGWHGTDCACSGCAADRIPGRYA